MSFSTLFGAYAAPAGAAYPGGAAPAGAPGFRGASRSGAFHAACAALLDALPGYDALGFLAAHRPAPADPATSDATMTHVIEVAMIEKSLAQLVGLRAACSARTDLVHGVLHDFLGSCERHELALALEKPVVCVDLNAESRSGEDGDSPEFFCNALLSLQSLLQRASERSLTIVYYNWCPR